jgi:prepilin-type N-terminal cleavage/methylation domain-containing protein
MSHSRIKKGITSGFTLVEVMVALFIMSVSTGLLLANYPESTLRITLLNNTHSFALLVREAQIRGSAVDSVNNTIGGYGVVASLETPLKVEMFSDSVVGLGLVNSSGLSIGDGVYDSGVAPDQIKNTLNFKEGFPVKKICIASSTALYALAPYGFLCNEDNDPPITSITISYMRPSQEAHIYVNNSTSTDYDAACIQMYSPKSPEAGNIRSMVVYHSGIISTSVNPCN